MYVTYQRLLGPEYMSTPMNVTQGKEIDPNINALPSIHTWRKMLTTCGGVPHSPIRAVVYRIFAFDVPTWVSVHYTRHHVGFQPYVQSQRTDKQVAADDRGSARQDAPVNMVADLNANTILNIAKARLCMKASAETRELMHELRRNLCNSTDPYDKELGLLMNPPCEWYLKCFEPKPCVRFRRNRTIFMDGNTIKKW